MSNFSLYLIPFLESLSHSSSKNNAYFVFQGKERDKKEFKHKLAISSKMWRPSHTAYPASHFSLSLHDSSGPT